jgi:hypothetical protein
MCKALGAAHSKGIVHRDLKPHNVQLVIKADGALQVKILDFGVAKILASPDGASSVKTRTGSLMGTPLYMSPEQCKGAGVLDHRTDIYSLGVILFEMLSGRPPFNAEGVGELFAKHMLEDPPLVTEFVPAAPPHMAAAIMKSLAKEPDARFRAWRTFRKALVGEVQGVGVVESRACAAFETRRTRGVRQIIGEGSTTCRRRHRDRRRIRYQADSARRRSCFLGGGAALANRRRVTFGFSCRRPGPRSPSHGPRRGGPAARRRRHRFAAGGEEDRHHPLRGRIRRARSVQETRRRGPGRRAGRDSSWPRDAAHAGPRTQLAYVAALAPAYKERPLTDTRQHGIARSMSLRGRRRPRRRTSKEQYARPSRAAKPAQARR